MHKYIVILACLALVACGGTSAPPSAQSVLDAFKAAGLVVNNPQAPARDATSPLPNTYKERMTFEVPGAHAGKGGQVFTCDTKKNCDALYAYFDALKGLAGPYLYQSPSGLVVAQMNSGLTPDVAAKYEAVIKALP